MGKTEKALIQLVGKQVSVKLVCGESEEFFDGELVQERDGMFLVADLDFGLEEISAVRGTEIVMEIQPWQPDQTYRAGYDHACGYKD